MSTLAFAISGPSARFFGMAVLGAWLMMAPVWAQTNQRPTNRKAPAPTGRSAGAAKSGGAARLDRSKRPQPGPAPRIQLGKVEQFKLDNGLNVFVVTNRKLPRVSYTLMLDYDPILEGANTGYIDMAGEMLGTATRTRSKDQINEEVDFLGADLMTTASMARMSGLKRHSDKLIEIMADVVLNPRFLPEELELARKQRRSSLSSERTNPQVIASKVRSRLLYGPEHPYGEVTTEASLDAITIPMMEQFHQQYFRPDVAYMAVVGDISLEEARTQVTRHFGSWQRGSVPKKTYPTRPAPRERTIVLVDRPAAVQSYIEIAHTIDLRPDNPDVVTARVMNTVLGGSFTGRLFRNLRETKGYTYGSYSSVSPNKLIGSTTATASVRNAVTDSAIIEMLKEMETVTTTRPTAEEVALARNMTSGAFVSSLESPATLAQFAINTMIYGLPQDYYQTYLKRVEQVNEEAVERVAKLYIQPMRSYVIVVGRASEIAEPLKRLGKVVYYNEVGEPVAANTLKPAPAGMTARQVADRYVEAIGGRKTLEKTSAYELTYTGEVQGMPLTMRRINKGNDKARMEVTVRGMNLQTMIRNGAQVSSASMQGPKTLDEAEREEAIQSLQMFPELEGKWANEFTLKGIERVNDRDAYVLESLQPGQGSRTYYYAVDNGLRIKSVIERKTPDGPQVSTTQFDNYRLEKGVRVPGRLVVEMGPMSLPLELTDVKINGKPDDQLFRIN